MSIFVVATVKELRCTSATPSAEHPTLISSWSEHGCYEDVTFVGDRWIEFCVRSAAAMYGTWSHSFTLLWWPHEVPWSWEVLWSLYIFREAHIRGHWISPSHPNSACVLNRNNTCQEHCQWFACTSEWDRIATFFYRVVSRCMHCEIQTAFRGPRQKSETSRQSSFHECWSVERGLCVAAGRWKSPAVCFVKGCIQFIYIKAKLLIFRLHAHQNVFFWHQRGKNHVDFIFGVENDQKDRNRPILSESFCRNFHFV